MPPKPLSVGMGIFGSVGTEVVNVFRHCCSRSCAQHVTANLRIRMAGDSQRKPEGK